MMPKGTTEKKYDNLHSKSKIFLMGLAAFEESGVVFRLDSIPWLNWYHTVTGLYFFF